MQIFNFRVNCHKLTGCTRDIYYPNVNVSRMLLLAGASPHYVGGLMQNAPLFALFPHKDYEFLIILIFYSRISYPKL